MVEASITGVLTTIGTILADIRGAGKELNKRNGGPVAVHGILGLLSDSPESVASLYDRNREKDYSSVFSIVTTSRRSNMDDYTGLAAKYAKLLSMCRTMSVLVILRRSIMIRPRCGGLDDKQNSWGYNNDNGLYTSGDHAPKVGKPYRVFTRSCLHDNDVLQSGRELKRNLATFKESSSWNSMVKDINGLLQVGCSEIHSILEEEPVVEWGKEKKPTEQKASSPQTTLQSSDGVVVYRLNVLRNFNDHAKKSLSKRPKPVTLWSDPYTRSLSGANYAGPVLVCPYEQQSMIENPRVQPIIPKKPNDASGPWERDPFCIDAYNPVSVVTKSGLRLTSYQLANGTWIQPQANLVINGIRYVRSMEKNATDVRPGAPRLDLGDGKLREYTHYSVYENQSTIPSARQAAKFVMVRLNQVLTSYKEVLHGIFRAFTVIAYTERPNSPCRHPDASFGNQNDLEYKKQIDRANSALPAWFLPGENAQKRITMVRQVEGILHARRAEVRRQLQVCIKPEVDPPCGAKAASSLTLRKVESLIRVVRSAMRITFPSVQVPQGLGEKQYTVASDAFADLALINFKESLVPSVCYHYYMHLVAVIVRMKVVNTALVLSAAIYLVKCSLLPVRYS